jgi:hypothetical protein
MRGFIEAFCACNIERFLDAAIALTCSDPTVCANQGRWNVDPDQARMPVEQKSVGGCRGPALARRIAASSKRTFGSLNRRAHQAMGEKADERRL